MLLDSFLLEAQRSLDYCEHQLGLPPIQTVVLGMTDPATPALEQHLTAGLNARVTSMDLNQLLDVGDTASALAQAHCLRAVGAALRQEAGR
jgi:MSHA biogenesis protein MshI